MYAAEDKKVEKTLVPQLTFPSHDEANTKILYYACQIDTDANFTDVLIIMLANMNKLKCNLEISVEIGIGDHHRFININEIYARLASILCAALSACRAITSCDYNPEFFRKKKKPSSSNIGEDAKVH